MTQEHQLRVIIIVYIKLFRKKLFISSYLKKIVNIQISSLYRNVTSLDKLWSSLTLNRNRIVVA